MTKEGISEVGLSKSWQRAESVNGVPYYINHDTETTQWDHPAIAQLMTDLAGADDIKYAAYRTAVKLRAIEKRTKLYSIDLNTIRAGFNDLGYPEHFSEDEIDVVALEKILIEIFSYQNNKVGNINVADGVELTLNWLLNVYDESRSGFLPLLSVKIGLACLSVASVQEKYKYIFDQISSSKGFVDKKRLRIALKDALQLLKYIKEYNSFGRAGVEAAVQSCFERAFIPERISLQEFLDWMVDEPQTLVWLPTLHRLAMSETVKHEGKCNICKMFPIVGFRYRCLKCFNFDMCQDCFWSGRVSKNHKLAHQTQEYCLPATQKEDIKDFAKVVKSKVRKRKRRKKKKNATNGSFLPITNDDVPRASDDDVDSTDHAGNESTTSFESAMTSDRVPESEESSKEAEPVSSRTRPLRPNKDDEHQLISYYISCLNGNPKPNTSTPIQTLARLERSELEELDAVVKNLEVDNRFLQQKILEIQDEETRRCFVETATKERVEDHNERLKARQEVLEDHNRRLEDQLSKLQLLIEQKKETFREKKMAMPRKTLPEFSSSFNYDNSDCLAANPAYYEKLPRFTKLPTSEVVPEHPSTHHFIFNSQPITTSSGLSLGSMNRTYITNPPVGRCQTNSTSSEDDLRAIKERLERLLEPEESTLPRPQEGNNSPSINLQDPDCSSVSDEQQSLLLTAASMVGEAVEGFVANLSRGAPGQRYLGLDFASDEEV